MVAQRSHDRKDDWTLVSSKNDDSAGKEDDFFNSLMSDLSNDLCGHRSEDRGQRTLWGHNYNHNYAGPNAKVTEKSGGSKTRLFDNFDVQALGTSKLHLRKGNEKCSNLIVICLTMGHF